MRCLFSHRLLKFLVLLALFFCHTASYSTEQSHSNNYFVIVNAENPYQVENRKVALQEIKRLFLKEKLEWGSTGLEAEPTILPLHSDAGKTFVSKVLNMTNSQLDQHWISAKQQTGAIPPTVIRSQSIVLKTVENKPGAFGIISYYTFAQLFGNNKNHNVRVLLSF